MQHNPAGNVVADGVSIFSYSPRGTLLRQPPQAPGFEYVYDGDGRRLHTAKTGGANLNVIHYLLPDGSPYFEDHAAGGTANDRSLVYLGDRLLATFDPTGSVSHVVTDHIGFPLATVSGGGKTSWKAEAYPFGQVAAVYAGSAEADPLLRYPGQWEPPWMATSTQTLLFYNTHRWYNPGWGRYTQADPIGLLGGDLGLYSYARDNPLRLVDPLGRESCPPSTVRREQGALDAAYSSCLGRVPAFPVIQNWGHFFGASPLLWLFPRAALRYLEDLSDVYGCGAIATQVLSCMRGAVPGGLRCCTLSIVQLPWGLHHIIGARCGDDCGRTTQRIYDPWTAAHIPIP